MSQAESSKGEGSLKSELLAMVQMLCATNDNLNAQILAQGVALLPVQRTEPIKVAALAHFDGDPKSLRMFLT